MIGGRHSLSSFLLGIAVAGLTACAGGGDTTSTPSPTPTAPSAPTLSLGFGLKQLQFNWTAASGADQYRLLQNPDGMSGFSQVGNNLAASTTNTALDIAVHRHNWAAARYALDACNSAGCTRSNEISTAVGMLQAIGYFKSSNPGTGDTFGHRVTLSDDGGTLAVGAIFEDSAAKGINGNQADNSALEAGAAYVFSRSGSTWAQQAYVKASNTEGSDRFGVSLALSSDGNTLAVSADLEDSSAIGIDGNQDDSSAADAGAVYVFTRSGGTWSQQAYLKASNTQAFDQFGFALALSADGNTLAVSARLEDGNAIGINGDQTNNLATNAGAVYVFTRSGGGVWSQQAYVKASNTGAGDGFGLSVALSSDGNTMTVGAYLEDSSVNSTQADNSAVDAGALYVFTRTGTAWSQQAYLKASNAEAGDQFGFAQGLSGDGNTLAVSARLEDSSATGINGNQGDNSVMDAGALYIFTRSGSTWSQQAWVKSSNPDANDNFGSLDSVALSDDGNTLAVGAHFEDSAATGINGNQADNSADGAGAVYVYARSGGIWSQQAYVKASNTEAGDRFFSVALSSDGNTLAVGANMEDSAATGINGNQADNSAGAAGAVYLY